MIPRNLHTIKMEYATSYSRCIIEIHGLDGWPMPTSTQVFPSYIRNSNFPTILEMYFVIL